MNHFFKKNLDIMTGRNFMKSNRWEIPRIDRQTDRHVQNVQYSMYT